MHSRPTILRGAVAVTAAAALLVPGSAAAAVGCKSSDLRYPFQKGGPKDFGVFRLTVTNASCATARSVAKAWKHDFEAALRAGRVKLPKHEGGFTFKTLRANQAQTYRERGTKGAAVIRFDYRVPNG